VLGAIEIGERRQKKGRAVSCRCKSQTGVEKCLTTPLFVLKQQSPFLADKRLKGLGQLRQKPRQEHLQAHVILGYVD
jgi:hypothetical protein